jgi:hypothetical protein
MKKLSIVGIILIIVGSIFFVLSGVYYQIYQDDIHKMKTIPVKAGSSTPFISRVPDILSPEHDVIHGLILLSSGIVIMIISRKWQK